MSSPLNSVLKRLILVWTLQTNCCQTLGVLCWRNLGLTGSKPCTFLSIFRCRAYFPKQFQYFWKLQKLSDLAHRTAFEEIYKYITKWSTSAPYPFSLTVPTSDDSAVQKVLQRQCQKHWRAQYGGREKAQSFPYLVIQSCVSHQKYMRKDSIPNTFHIGSMVWSWSVPLVYFYEFLASHIWKKKPNTYLYMHVYIYILESVNNKLHWYRWATSVRANSLSPGH